MAALPVLPKLPLPHAPGSCRHTIYPRQAHYIPRSVLPNSKTLWENACVMLSRADNSGVRGRVFSLELTPLAPLDF